MQLLNYSTCYSNMHTVLYRCTWKMAKKKCCRRGERTPPFFIKRKQPRLRKNHRTLAHGREGQDLIFLHTGGNSSQLEFELATSWGRPYLSGKWQEKVQSFLYLTSH